MNFRQKKDGAIEFAPKTAGIGVPILLIHNVDPAWDLLDQDACRQEAERLVRGLEEAGHVVECLELSGLDGLQCLGRYRDRLVFNWCDGLPGVKYGEVRVARALERLGMGFTGASSYCLRLSYDKPKVKTILERAGIPTPKWVVANNHDIHWSKFPAIVKPAHEHSSVGVTSESVVLGPSELGERINFVLNELRQPALVEDFIDGREFHVGVWGNRPAKALPPVEMDFGAFEDIRDRLCTWDSKFNPASVHYQRTVTHIPAPLSRAEIEAISAVAIGAYRALGCRDYARMDIRLRDGIYYVLDVNPNADLSPDASFACAAETIGYSFGQMLSQIVVNAFERLAARGKVFANVSL